MRAATLLIGLWQVYKVPGISLHLSLKVAIGKVVLLGLQAAHMLGV